MNTAKSEESPAAAGGLDNLSPRQIVEELDKYIIGQENAKRALAVALRDRIRRQRLPADLLEEVQPRNIILIGPTGVGKTELARRLARLSNSPFIKVEASKFTEVGYVGRDVESIVRDLADIAVDIVRQEKVSQIEKLAEENAHKRLVEILKRPEKRRRKTKAGEETVTKAKATRKTRARLLEELSEGKLDDQVVELEVQERFVSTSEWSSDYLEEESDLPLRDLLAALAGSRTMTKEMRGEEAIEYLITEEENKLIDMDHVTREALDRLEMSGIVFVDELDKIAGRESRFGPEVSREGVQRDILPIVEGTSVNTRIGMVRTDHILFIAAGAFHVAKPADLIPELQGRFPIRVEMEPLKEEDLRAILSQPKNALTKQYTALLATEGVELKFDDDAINEIAHLAWAVNETGENIGARRLHTMMETLLEEVSFEGPDLKQKRVRIDRAYVRERLASKVRDLDLSRYIL